jgi:hypothetical protein
MAFSERGWVRTVTWLGLGLLAGIVLGLLLGWVAWPVQFSDADPSIMERGYQLDYTVMIAGAYSLDEDMSEARRLLSTLGKEDSLAWLLEVTVDAILNNGDETDTRHLVKLADDLGLYSPAMDPYLPVGNSES